MACVLSCSMPHGDVASIGPIEFAPNVYDILRGVPVSDRSSNERMDDAALTQWLQENDRALLTTLDNFLYARWRTMSHGWCFF